MTTKEEIYIRAIEAYMKSDKPLKTDSDAIAFAKKVVNELSTQ